jgi:malonyl-CoA O-methyltransferase
VFRLSYSRQTLALNSQHPLSIADVRRRFDRAADKFDDADFVHSVTREGLFARLEPVVIEATTVVDLGSATGTATHALGKRFRGANVIAVDLSRRMLEKCRKNRGWFSRTGVVQANAAALPFADQSIDVVFANMLLPWVDDPARVAAEVSRVLRTDGLFVFATLGPDSLLELRSAWASVDNGAHINHFLDMHDVGDTLVKAGLRDPILDVDRLTVTYGDSDGLFRDLAAAGARNSLRNRQSTMTGKRRFGAMREKLESSTSDGRISLDLELVYGHCWGGGPRVSGGEVHISAGAIPIRRR